MLKQGSGAIVNASAVPGGMVGAPGATAYLASKAGIVSLTREAALEYAEYGVRVNVICLGFTRTPMLEQIFELNPQAEADWIMQVPMGRLSTPEEAAEAAQWLCSDASSFVTGTILAVDGGFHAQ
jgi:NAD(P)-dependent dehydrogenase (short-subunit alcohol dehydrogenase family)